MTSTIAAIAAEDLRKTYAGGIEALRGVTFAVAPGEVFGLLGPNGAGKSTTVRILATLSTPTAGSARVVGLDVLQAARAVRRRIGYVAQVSGVDPTATGRENLQLQGRLFQLPAAQVRARGAELLDLFQLSTAADRLVRTWSGGMKRRLDVAMGLVHRPEVLFLDEPTTGLDLESRAVMWREIARLAREGLTVLLTTHYLEEADRLAERLAIVDRGQIVAAGTPAELKRSLGGEHVSLELRDSAQVAAAAASLGGLRATGEVTELVVDGTILHARVADGARQLAGLVSAIEHAGLVVSQVGIRRPSLDDVYLRATGHAYRSEGRAEDAAVGTAGRAGRKT